MANGTKLKKDWSKAEVLARLKSNGLHPVLVAGTDQVSHIEAPESAHIGLKLWAYIDFLGVRVVRG